MIPTTTIIGADFVAALQARFPDLDWDGIMALPGYRSLQEVAEWALAAGVDPDVVETLMAIEPPGWTQ